MKQFIASGVCVFQLPGVSIPRIRHWHPSPQFVLTGPGPQFVFTGHGTPFLQLSFPAFRFAVKVCYSYSVYFYKLTVFLYILISEV